VHIYKIHTYSADIQDVHLSGSMQVVYVQLYGKSMIWKLHMLMILCLTMWSRSWIPRL